MFITIITPDISNTVDPRAWIKKYFRAASDEYWLSFIEIRGIKERRFSSSPIQTPNQDLDPTEIAIPSTNVARNNCREGESIIKKRGV